MDESSILCRVLGSLYCHQPQDPLLVPLFTLIRESKLAASWSLGQDELLTCLQKSYEMQSLATGYNILFVGKARSVSSYRNTWVEGSSEAEVRAFMSEHDIPIEGGPANRLGSLLLAAPWLENYTTEDQSETLELLFIDYALPWCGMIPGKAETYTHTPFWRTMAPLTRDAVVTMWDELQEKDKQ